MVDETENPRDVLAAEEFVVPAPDPRLRKEAAHDILAAEEFAVPAPDPRLSVTSQPLRLPPDPKDPAGTEPAHDVLAAEEFAVPGTAAEDTQTHADAASRRQSGRVVLALAVVALLVNRLRRRRS